MVKAAGGIRRLARTFAILSAVGALGFAEPLSAQGPPNGPSSICLGCTEGCEEADGGTICDHKGPGGIGFSGCEVVDSPTGNCFCLMKGELCEVPDGEDPGGMALESEALDAVRGGRMLRTG